MNGLPYYKAYPRDFIEGTIGMPFEMKCAYRVVLDLIYMQGGRLPDDGRYISGLLGCSVRKWKAIREFLIEAGKIHVNGDFLTNYRADKELETLAKLQDKQRENASRTNKNNGLQKPRPRHTEPEPEPYKGITPLTPFSSFWALWPNKTAKKAAEKAWAKLNQPDREAVLSLPGAGFEAWRRRSPRADPIHPATFLNGRRWEDEPTREVQHHGRTDGQAAERAQRLGERYAEQQRARGVGGGADRNTVVPLLPARHSD